VKITLEDLDRWGACERKDGQKHSDAALRLLFPAGAATPLQVVQCRKLPKEDRIWVLLRAEVLGAQLPAVVKAIVDPCVKKHCLKCGVPAVESWARGWLSGTDRHSRAAGEAWAEAGEAVAWVAAAWAAAARAAAARAASAVASAAWAAGGDRAAAAERQRQLAIIKQALKEVSDEDRRTKAQ
jgi:hypothetical protein